MSGKYRGRRKGLAIRKGSVRQARLEARLSLAQVADGQVSRTAVHHIENDRVKPSVETLQLIARQTHKPIDYFLLTPDAYPELVEPRQELQELERLTASREFETVVRQGLPLLDKRWSDEGAARLHFHLGQAYCRLVQPQEALEQLPAAREHFERVGNEWMAVEALDWEASAWGLLEDPKALALGMQALARCRKIDPRPQELEARILGHLAGMYVVAHSWALAISHYEAAVEAASAVKDLLQLAKMHHGLGAAHHRLQNPATARQHFDRALSLYSIESDQSAVYRVENDLGLLLLEQGQLDSAEEHLLKALAGAEELHMDRRGRSYIMANLGAVNLRQGRLDEARGYLSQAAEIGEVMGERIALAEARVLQGELEERLGNLDMADDLFHRALHILDELGMPDRLRDGHMEYAELLERRGDIAGAARHWRIAAEIGKWTAAGVPQRARHESDLQQVEAGSAS